MSADPLRDDEENAALWELTTWEGNRRWRRDRTLASTPLERLRWLESALRLAQAAGALPRQDSEPSSSVHPDRRRPA